MKKYFVVTDVHSFFKEMKKALDDAGYDVTNSDHILISCGDLLDRGSQTIECLQFVNSIPKNRKILIRGNHENLLEECLERREFSTIDYHNGTAITVYDLGCGLSYADSAEDLFIRAQHNSSYKKYMKSLVNYAEVGDYIFVHGWIPCSKDKAKDPNYTFDPNWKSGDWKEAAWLNGMEAWSKGIKIDGKTIVCGHWHCSYGNSKLHKDGLEFPNPRSTNPAHRYANFDPFIDDGIIALDACTALTRKVNCFVFEN